MIFKTDSNEPPSDWSGWTVDLIEPVFELGNGLPSRLQGGRDLQVPIYESFQDGQTIIVTGHLYRSNGTGVVFAGYADGGSGMTTDPTLYPPGEGGGGDDPLPTPPDLNCSDKSQMTPQQRLDYEISEEAAEIAREIMATGDKDGYEYASLIYRDANGVITHTPIARGTPWSSVPSMIGILESDSKLICVIS